MVCASTPQWSAVARALQVLETSVDYFLFFEQAGKTLGRAAEPQASGPPRKTLHNKCSCSRASRGVKRALCRSGCADCASASPVVSCGRPGVRPSHPAPVQGPDANVVHLQEYHCILRNVDTTLLSCRKDASGTCWKQRSSAQCTNVLHTLWSQDEQMCCRFRMEMWSLALIPSLKG